MGKNSKVRILGWLQEEHDVTVENDNEVKELGQILKL